MTVKMNCCLISWTTYNRRFQSILFFSTLNEKPEVEASKQNAENASGVSQKGVEMTTNRICFNCGSRAHIAPSCPIPIWPKGACYGCDSTKHQRSTCSERKQKIKDANKKENLKNRKGKSIPGHQEKLGYWSRRTM